MLQALFMSHLTLDIPAQAEIQETIEALYSDLLPSPEAFGLRGTKSLEIVREADIRLDHHSGRKHRSMIWISSKGLGYCNLIRGGPAGHVIRQGCQQPVNLRAKGHKIPVNAILPFVYDGLTDHENERTFIVEITGAQPRCQASATASGSAQPDMLGDVAPHLDRQSWDPGKLTDIRGDQGQPLSHTGSRQPQIMRPNQRPRCGQLSPYSCMSPGRG